MDLHWGHQGCSERDNMTWPTNISSFIPANMTSSQNTCLLDANHTAVPRKQLPTYCCLAFWFMDNMNLSTKPSSCRADNGPESETRAKGHAVPNEVHRQPLFNLFLLGSQVDGTAPSVTCSRKGSRILSQRGVCFARDREVEEAGRASLNTQCITV